MVGLSIVALIVGAVYGWVFYQAVIEKSIVCTIICSISFGLYEADRFYKSDMVRGFIAGFNKEQPHD